MGDELSDDEFCETNFIVPSPEVMSYHSCSTIRFNNNIKPCAYLPHCVYSLRGLNDT